MSVITNRASDTPNLRGGHFAPRSLYFFFYLFCRRQQTFAVKRNRDFGPTFSAWSGLGALMAIPWLVLILAINQYFPFLRHLGHLWVALHLPGQPNKAWGYIWFIVGSITWIGIFAFLFRGRYEKIMREFSAYDRSQHIFAPAVVLFLVWIAMMGNAGHAAIAQIYGNPHILLMATALNIGIFLVTEIVFRFWWRWWRQEK